jgi:hypothetical protein
LWLAYYGPHVCSFVFGVDLTDYYFIAVYDLRIEKFAWPANQHETFAGMNLHIYLE